MPLLSFLELCFWLEKGCVCKGEVKKPVKKDEIQDEQAMGDRGKDKIIKFCLKCS